MIIAIFQDGNHVKKPDLESAFMLPGSYFVFSIGNKFYMNREDGILFTEKDKTTRFFKLNYLELIDIEKINNNYTPFRFSIYDYQTDSIRKISPKFNTLENALSSIVKTMIAASKFPSWNDYNTAENIEDYKSQIAKLQEENENLKKKNDELIIRLQK